MNTTSRLRQLLAWLLAAQFVLAACATGAGAQAATAGDSPATATAALQRSTHSKRHKRHRRHRRHHRARVSRVAQLAVSTSSPTSGQTVAGGVSWQASVSGAQPTRVDFAVDGGVKWSQSASPYVYGGSGGTLDTTKLADGSHTLTATAYGSKGVKQASSQITVNVANAPPAGTSGGTGGTGGGTGGTGGGTGGTGGTGGGAPNSVYWGAWIGDQFTGHEAPWDMTAVSDFEQLAGKPLSVEQFGSPFADCTTSPCSFYPFPWTPFNDIRAHGSIPFLSWSSQSLPSSVNEPNFQLSDVINGTYDSYISTFAAKARDWGHPFFLRLNWEMNGDWFPWSEGVNGNKAGEYVAAWRHIHDLFTAAGANNATWVWCPNVDPGNKLQNLNSLYPGDSYVDWTCLDGYNWGTNPVRPLGWQSFDQLFGSTYNNITNSIAPSKPMAIGEFGSTESGGSKAAWIQDALNKIPTNYPKIRAALYFEHYTEGMDWPMETSPSSTSAFASAIQNPAYASNTFANLNTTTVQPPSG